MKAINTILTNAQKLGNENDKKIVDILEKVANLLKRVKGLKLNSIKILTPQQMLSRLPILLAQIEAGNNSQKLKNEARQLLYSLYKSRKIIKTVYNRLMRSI